MAAKTNSFLNSHLLSAVLFPEVHVLVFVDLLDHVQSLAHQLLLDDLEELVLLQGFTGHVQWQIVGIHNTADEGQVLGHHVLKVVRDEDAAHVQLDLVNLLAVVLEHVVGSGLGNEQDGLEGNLSLSGEVSLAHGIVLVLGEALVEFIVLLILNLI